MIYHLLYNIDWVLVKSLLNNIFYYISPAHTQQQAYTTNSAQGYVASGLGVSPKAATCL